MKRGILFAAMWVGLLAIGPVVSEKFPATGGDRQDSSDARLRHYGVDTDRKGPPLVSTWKNASEERMTAEEFRIYVKWLSLTQQAARTEARIEEERMTLEAYEEEVQKSLRNR